MTGEMMPWGVVVAVALVVSGCEKKEDPSTADAAPSAPPVATATGTGAAAATETAAVTGAATVAAAAGAGAAPQAAHAPDASAVITNLTGDKKVTVGTSPTGTSLTLQNDAGKGSVTSGAGGTTITGKSGKTVTIPGTIPGIGNR